MMAVDLAAALPDIVAAPAAVAAPIDTSGEFAVSGVALQGTVVRMRVQAGVTASCQDLFVELFDRAIPNRSAAPVSTYNFLSYVNTGAYSRTVFHRATDFASDAGPAVFLQGGTFLNNGTGFGTITPGAPIPLEYGADRPNVAGTIAFARTTDPNSATSGFFFNVASNPFFDAVSNQYAVFGHVVGNGQEILNQLAACTRVNAGGAFTTLPVSDANLIGQVNPYNLLLTVQSATVVAAPEMAVGLSVISSDSAIVTAQIDADGKLQLVYGSKHGTALVTVTATDLSGATRQDSFNVSVGTAAMAVASGTTPISNGQSLAVALGSAFKGALSPQTTFTVTNTGDVPLPIQGISLPPGLTQVQGLPTTILPGRSANLVVAFDTTTPGTNIGVIGILSSSAAGTFAIPFSASVTLSPPAVAISAAGSTIQDAQARPFDFGVSSLLSATAGTTFTITNSGQQDLVLGSVSAPRGFTILEQPLSTLLTEGASTTFRVGIDRTVGPGRITGSISIPSNSPQAIFSLPAAVVITRDIVLSPALTSLSYIDSDGTKVTYSVTGPGSATFGLTNAGVPTIKGKAATVTAAPGTAISAEALSLVSTTAASVITATTAGGDGQVQLARINGASPLGGIRMPGVRATTSLALPGGVAGISLAGVSGSATIGGAGVTSASLGRVDHATLSLPATATFVVGALVNSTIALGAVGTLTAGVTTLSDVKVTGTLTAATFASLDGSSLSVTGNVGTITVAATASASIFDLGAVVNKVTLGRMTSSTLRVGVVAGVSMPALASDFLPGSNLKALQITGKVADVFQTSTVFVAALGTAAIGRLTADPALVSTFVVRTASSISGAGPAGVPFSVSKIVAGTNVDALLPASLAYRGRLKVTTIA